MGLTNEERSIIVSLEIDKSDRFIRIIGTGIVIRRFLC